MFPEATISQSFTVKDIKSGAARLAAAAGRAADPDGAVGDPAAVDQGSAANADPAPRADHDPGRASRCTRRASDNADAVTAELRTRMTALLDRAQREYPTASPTGDDWWQPAHLGGTAPTPESLLAAD